MYTKNIFHGSRVGKSVLHTFGNSTSASSAYTVKKMIKAVLIDLSGTLHVGDAAILGAQEALKKLRETGVLIRFVTNTTKESRNILFNRLTKLEFELQKEEMHSSLIAAKSVIESNNLKPFYLLENEAMEDFKDLIPDNNNDINAVVIGLAPSQFHYDKMNEAFRYLLNGAKLIAIHEGKYYKTEDGLLSLGPGCFVKGLEYSAQCKAEVVGKPKPNIFRSALLDINPQDAVMIGDDVKDDIKGAMDAGLQGFLVQTGKYRDGDENTITPKPSAVCKSFVEAVELIISNINQESCS